ncbi:hypothetical protein ECFRIK1990_6079, partial [Escherichia coli FRIK1990]
DTITQVKSIYFKYIKLLFIYFFANIHELKTMDKTNNIA